MESASKSEVRESHAWGACGVRERSVFGVWASVEVWASAEGVGKRLKTAKIAFSELRRRASVSTLVDIHQIAGGKDWHPSNPTQFLVSYT